jgi:hypothetical protein
MRIFPAAIERTSSASCGSWQTAPRRIKAAKNHAFSSYSIACPFYFISVKAAMITRHSARAIAHVLTMLAEIFAVLKWPLSGQIGAIAIADFPVRYP